MMNTTRRCTCSVSQHQCRLAGGFYNSLPVTANWFGMALNVADSPREHRNRVEVDRERV